MRLITTTILLAVLGIGAAHAQSATPAPATAPAAAPAPDATAPASGDLTKDGKVRMKVVRQQCRDEVKGSGATGEARRDAMAACIVKARPDKAAQVHCAMDPAAKGLAKDARRAFIKDCVAKAKG